MLTAAEPELPFVDAPHDENVAEAIGFLTAKVLKVVDRQSGKVGTPDSRLDEDLELDSVDRIDLALKLEERFDIDIPDEDVDLVELGTVKGLVSYLFERGVR